MLILNATVYIGSAISLIILLALYVKYKFQYLQERRPALIKYNGFIDYMVRESKRFHHSHLNILEIIFPFPINTGTSSSVNIVTILFYIVIFLNAVYWGFVMK